jgi:ABC-type amino acid transport system permease subunit
MIPAGPDRFHGIYPSTVLPMGGGNFVPDWDAYARHTAHCVLRPGIAGMLMNGHAGENFVLSRDEKRRAVEVTGATVGASRIVVAGVNAESSLDAAAEAREARAAGADAIMVFLPNGFALAHTTEMALLHHRTILAAVPGMPVFLFAAHHGAGRMAFTPDTLAALLDIRLGVFMAAMLAIAACDSAFEAEIFRAGIQSVEQGQREAAMALGLGPWQRMRFVILPQAIRRVLPPMANQFVYVVKMSSLASVIGYQEMTRKANELVVTVFRPLEICTILILEYLVLILLISAAVRRLERRMGADQSLRSES